MNLLDEVLSNLPPFVHPTIHREEAEKELSATRHSIQPVAQPRIYQIETTSRCNLACPFCPRTTDLLVSGARDLKATMSIEAFRGVLDQMPWLKSIELFHFGEPFMHRDLEVYVQECTDRGIYSVIASNLLPATKEKVDRVFKAGLSFLVMDVDSLDPARYASMRVNGNLHRLREIVLYILSKPQPRPYLVAQTICLDGKPEYTEEEFLAWTLGARPDEIRYKFLDSFRGEIADKGGLGPEDLCREPFYGFTVHVNGDVVPCDRDWSGVNVMGNVFKQSVTEIWNGEKYQAFRAAMKSGEKPEMCRRCPEGRLVNLRSQPLVQVNMFKGKEVEHR